MLGTTGIVVSRLGLGLAAVGRPGYINLGRAHDLPAARTPEALYARTAELLDAARAAGIRYLDVARSYGRAEEFLARWLGERAVGPRTFTIGSKWGYRYAADWRVDAPVHEEKELSLARFTQQLAETRALLGAHLDLYQIHSATAESGCLEDTALLRALVEGRRAGAYRAVGLTLSGPTSARALALALAARADGEPVFDVVQATFNCLEPSLAAPLAAAHDAGLGVIVKEALANGRLTEANARPEDAHLVGALGHQPDFAHGRRQDERVRRLRQLAELPDVLLRDAELHRLEAARHADRVRDLADALRRRLGDGEDGRGLALGLVDLLLLLRLGGLDHLLLLALGGVDGRVALALGGEDGGALLPLGPHLLLHRGEHVGGRRDVF